MLTCPTLIGKSSKMVTEKEITSISKIEISFPHKLENFGNWGKTKTDTETHKIRHPTAPSKVFFPTFIRPKALPEIAAAASPRMKRDKEINEAAAAKSEYNDTKLQIKEPPKI